MILNALWELSVSYFIMSSISQKMKSIETLSYFIEQFIEETVYLFTKKILKNDSRKIRLQFATYKIEIDPLEWALEPLKIAKG